MSFGLFSKAKKIYIQTSFLNNRELMSVEKPLEEELLRSIQTAP